MTRKNIAVLGAGGFGREVAWLIDELINAGAPWRFAGFLVSEQSRIGPFDSVDQIIGDLNWLENRSDEIDALALGIGNPSVRLSLSRELPRRFPWLEWPALIHPSVNLDSRSAEIGDGALLCAGVIGTVNLHIEPFALINLSCTLGHEARIGQGSVLNPSVNVSGGVSIGEGVLMGTGAQVLQYLKVGDAAVVGAGAVVTRNVPAGSTVVGVPAKPLALSPSTEETIKERSSESSRRQEDRHR